MKKIMKGMLVAAVVLCVGFAASAKKMSIMNPSKGGTFNTSNNAEIALTEEHGKKGDEMMLKIALNGGGWWAGMESPNKSWAGFDVMKFRLFNESKEPMKLALHIKFNDYSCPWEKRFVYDFMARPGENNIEIELMGATTVDGTPIDWKTKIMAASFTGEKKKVNIYFGNITLETQEDEGK